MPRALAITQAQQTKITELYVSGAKPAEIAGRLRIKPDTVRKYVSRRGLTARKTEIAEAQAQTMQEAIAQARRENVPVVLKAMRSLIDGLAGDAERLERDGWGLVDDAAGASSLQRAKSLLGGRMLELAGVADSESHRPGISGVGLFYFAGPALRIDPVDAAEPALPIQS